MSARLTRLLGAALLIAGGLIHYDLWEAGYRHIPRIGPLFIANFVLSIAIAGALVVTGRATVALAGIVLAAGSLVGLVLSRTVGVLGFTETGWTPQAISTLGSEVGAILTLGFVLCLQLRATDHRSPTPTTVSQP